jgi:hypothetical protein
MPADIAQLSDKRLMKLKPAQFARELMGLPAKRRMDLIFERSDAQSVVAALDANDFFHTVVEIGADDSLPLIALAGMEQLSHLFDIEWWRKDTLEPAKALVWIDRLWRAGGSSLAEWLYNVDFELLVSLFKQWITVDTAPDDIDLVEAVEQLPERTLDDTYFWESKYPQYDDLITHMLTIVFETNYSFFKELINSVLYGSAADVEESAYHFHRARLMDHGIPDFYDALEIYRSIGPDEFVAKKKAPRKADENERLPLFAMVRVPDGDLFAGITRGIRDPALLETIQVETAALANKVMVADRLSPDNFESLRRAVEKSLAYINLGLELRSGADIEKAAQIVGDTFLEHLFRIAQAEVAAVRGRLQAIVRSGWLSQYPAGLRKLDGLWFDAAEELLAATPRIVKNRSGGSLSDGALEFEFFRTPSDLARAGHIIDVIGAAGNLYRLLGAQIVETGKILWTDGQVRAPEDITLGVMVLTAAANFISSGKWTAEPLSRTAWKEIFPVVKPSAINSAVTDWIDRSIPDEKVRSLAGTYLIPVLRDYEEEMGPFSDLNPPEMQLVKFFMFSE